MPSSHLILRRPLLLLPSIFPSIRVFSNELTLHISWPKYWSFSFSVSPSNEYSGLISFVHTTAAAAATKSLQSCPTPCDPMNCSTPGLPVHHQLLEFPQTHVHRVGDAIQPSHPLPSPIPPRVRDSSSESTLHMRRPKYWSCSFSIIASKEIPGLISFRMDWLDLLAVQGTLNSFLQHHSSKASVIRHSTFLTVQI